MVQGAVLVTAVGLAVFFLLIPASIWLLKSTLGGIGADPTDETDEGTKPHEGQAPERGSGA